MKPEVVADIFRVQQKQRYLVTQLLIGLRLSGGQVIGLHLTQLGQCMERITVNRLRPGCQFKSRICVSETS